MEPILLLTETEKEAVTKLACLAGSISEIIGKGPARANDLNEMAHHIHALQNMILSQAAARAYPDRYRLLGEVLREPR